MKKFFAYEFKKRLSALIIMTLICTLPYVVSAGSFPMYEDWRYGDQIVREIIPPLAWMPLVGLFALCYVVPAMTYSFKMQKRSVDCYYSLPLKKEKLYLIKTLVGLLLVLIPFTTSFWSGFLVTWIRPENPYTMGWYVPLYFGLLLFGVCLYGFNAFIFSRANHPMDGIVFMLAYTLVGFLALLVLHLPFEVKGDGEFIERILYFLTPAGGIHFMVNLEQLIFYGTHAEALAANSAYEWNAWMFVVPVIYGAIGYVFLFFNIRFEKAEDAEQNSDSWFGYKVLIPIYVACILSFLGLMEVHFSVFAVIFSVISAFAVVLTIIYRRKFRFESKYWLMIGIGLTAGIILAIVINSVY